MNGQKEGIGVNLSQSNNGGASLDPELTVLQTKLLQRTSRLLVIIVGEVISTSLAEKTSLADVQAIDQFHEVLGEIDALWEENKHDPLLRYRLSTCAAKIEALLETSCDFLYRLTYRYSEPLYGQFRECVMNLATHMLNWTLNSREVQQKLLTNGVLFIEVKAIELLTPYFEEKEALILMSFHLQFLYHCFVHNGFRVVYEFSGKNWTDMIQETTTAPSFSIKLLSKALACLFSHALPHDQYVLMTLDDSEVKILCEHLSHADEVIMLPDFQMAIAIEEFVVLLKNFCLYDPNRKMLLGQPILLPALCKLVTCYETDTVKVSLFLLLLELTKSPPVFEDALTQCSMYFTQSVFENTTGNDWLLRNISSVLLCRLQGRDAEPAIQQHIQDTAKVLSEILNDTGALHELRSDLFEVSHDLLNISNEGAKILLDSNLVPVLLNIASKLFEDLVADGSIPTGLPPVLYSILQWSTKYKELCHYVTSEHNHLLIAGPIHQLKTLGKFGVFTWFNRFLVNVNLFILLNCLQEEDFCLRFGDLNWPHVLLPWLKCGEQETQLVAFLTVCCLSHHFYDEDESIFQIDKHESQALLTCLTEAIELPNLSAPLCSNMFRISALHLIMSLKLFMINLKIAFKPKKMFGIMATLLVNGGLPEICMACDYISAMKELKEVDFKLFMEECELPVVEILEGLKEIEDTEVKLASERAILAIQNCSNENGGKNSVQQKIENYLINSASIINEMLSTGTLDLSLYEKKCESLNVVLMELQSQYVSLPLETKKTMGDYIASSCSTVVILNFMGKLAEHLISDKTDKVFLQSLNVLLSFLGSLSDICVRMRYRIMRTDLLIHLANVISFFSDLDDNEEMVLKYMLLNSITVLSNCAQEHDFSLLYTPPGVVDWASLIESWIISPSSPLRFSAKTLAGYIERSFKEDQYFLFDLTPNEFSTFCQMLNDSSASEKLVGAGFGSRYSSKELLVMLNNLILSKNNYFLTFQAQYIDIIINSFLNLMMRDGDLEKKSVCRILLKLLNSADFRKKLENAGMEGILSEVNATSDPCLKFLSQCICLHFHQLEDNNTDFCHHEIQYGSSLLPDLSMYFEEMLASLSNTLAQIIERFEGRPINISTKRFPGFNYSVEAIEEIYNFWRLSVPSVKEALGKVLSHQFRYLTTLHTFCMKIYSVLCSDDHDELALRKGGNEMLGPHFVQLSLCFFSWVRDSEEIRNKVIEIGFLSDYVKILSASRLSQDTKFERFVVTTYLNILLQCVQMPQIQVYLNKIHWFKAINRWAFCTHQELRLISKFVIGYLASAFELEGLLALRFDEDDIQAILNLLHEAAELRLTSKHFFFNISVNTLLNSLNCLLLLTSDHLALKENFQELIYNLRDESAMKYLFEIMQKGSNSERVNACSLLWTLSRMENCTTSWSVKHFQEVMDKTNTENEVKVLCECVMTSLDGTRLKDFYAFETYVNWCFVHNLPDLCISTCDEIIKRKFSHPLDSIQLLKGKSHFLQYTKEMRKLKLSSLSEDMKKRQYEVVFIPNKLAIKILGEALDQGTIDDEGSYMLDRAMMDCIFKANMLHLCNRCYLCRRKLCGKEKLIKSHIIPHAILDTSSPQSKGSKQTIYASGTAMNKANSRLLAPGEVVYYMLCQNCETIISINGETQFSPKFFHKIIDENEDNDLTANGLSITYGPWLHQFCISLVFRAMRWDVDDFLNDDVIYAKFKHCRASILSWSNGQNINPPKVYIFVSPTGVGINEQLQHKYMNWFLRGTLSYFFGSNDSKNLSLLLSPSFFVIQLGILNVSVCFDESFGEGFDQFMISPSGGEYFVPPHLSRRQSMPSSLWHLLIYKSRGLEKLMSDSVLHSSTRSKDPNPDSAANHDPVKIGTGIAAAAMVTITQSISNMQVKSHRNLLPTQFSITSTPKKVELPKGHKILLHSNYVRGPKSGSTFFIIVGNGKKYPISKPYVIWHFYEPSGTITSGAFFSIHNLEVTDFLWSNKTSEMRAGSFQAAIDKMPTIIKELLEEKGFSSIVSILHRARVAHAAGRSFPPFDTKCRKDRQCWYCKFLCQNCCLNHAAYGRMSPGPHGLYIFCSETCQALSPNFFKSPEVHIIASSETPPSGVIIHCSPISKTHQEILHLYIRRLNKQKYPCEIEFAICIGDGTESCPGNRPYVVFYSHHLCHQLFTEFFINVTLLAEEPLPQIANEISWNALLQLNEANALQKCLEQADLLETALILLSELSQIPSECKQESVQHKRGD